MSSTIGTSGETYFGIHTHLGDAHKAAVLKLDQWFAGTVAMLQHPLMLPMYNAAVRHIYDVRRARYREMSNAFLWDGDMDKGNALLESLLSDLQAYITAQVARLADVHSESVLSHSEIDAVSSLFDELDKKAGES